MRQSAILQRTFVREVCTWSLLGILGTMLTTGFLYSIITGHTLLLGILILIYFVLQLAFAGVNRSQCRRLLMGSERISMTEWMRRDFWAEKGAPHFREHPCRVGILVVGYREDPIYWRQCVESIRLYAPPSVVRTVCAAVDGNEAADEIMMNEFYSAWNRPREETPANSSGGEDNPLHEVCLETPVETAVLMLPHRGKRHTMRSGFEYLRMKYPDLDYIIVMDSDSVLTPNAVWSLVRVMDEDTANGCGTGSLEILNQSSFLARVVNARYAYAFQIERGAMAARGCMNCCSGPFSIYRMACLDEALLEAFVTQRCCMQPVGPGDDRHLTNLILARGYRSIQSPFSVALTECPTRLERFFIQQLRWMRSFYREQAFQIYALPVQSWYLMVVTLYEILFPFVVLLSLIPTFGVLHPTPVEVLRNRILVCVGVILLRTITLIVVTGRWGMWHNLFMLPLYFLVLLPMKMYALLTLGIQNWMTSNRMILRRLCNIDVLCMWAAIALWNGILTVLFLNRFDQISW